MSTTEEATVNPDGSTTFENEPPPVNEDDGGAGGGADEETFETIVQEVKGMDPAFYLLGGVIVLAILYFVYMSYVKKKDENDGDDFFASLDTEKVSVFHKKAERRKWILVVGT